MYHLLLLILYLFSFSARRFIKFCLFYRFPPHLYHFPISPASPPCFVSFYMPSHFCFDSTRSRFENTLNVEAKAQITLSRLIGPFDPALAPPLHYHMHLHSIHALINSRMCFFSCCFRFLSVSVCFLLRRFL